jgi:hypothetical protein
LGGDSCSILDWLRALSLLDSLTLPNKRLLQAAYVQRFRFDAGSSPALFPHGGSGPIVSSLAFDAAAEAQVVRRTVEVSAQGARKAASKQELPLGARCFRIEGALPTEFD